MTSLAFAAVLIVCTSDTSRPDVSPRVAPTRTALTYDEAIDRFTELHRQFRHASRERNLSGLAQLVTSNSPLIEVAQQDVKQLISDGVIDRSVFRNEQLDVTSTSPSGVSITQVVVIRPRFVDEKSGRALDTSAPIRQTVRWTLRHEDGQWKVHDAIVVSSEELNH